MNGRAELGTHTRHQAGAFADEGIAGTVTGAHGQLWSRTSGAGVWRQRLFHEPRSRRRQPSRGW